MPAGVTTAVAEDGRVLACKRATDGAGRARLRHEAAMLQRARHPGVVELVSCEDAGEATTITTSYAGSHSLDTVPRLPVERAAGLVATVASTVADLHQLGVVHGRLDPSHVVLGEEGRPVLCGFAGAAEIGTVPPPAPPAIAEYRDPAAEPGTPLSPATDVFALGTMLRALVVGEGVDLEPIPDRRFVRARPWQGYLRRSLLTLADQAADEEPLRRPSARRFAADIHELLPAGTGLLTRRMASDPYATLRPVDGDEPPEPASRHRLFAAAGVAVAFVVAFSAITTWRGNRTSAAPVVGAAPTTGAISSTTELSTTTVASATVPSTVTIDGHRYEIGAPGDRVALGDWDCDGQPTIAIVRPSTGEVFVFDSWPEPGSEVEVPAAQTVPGAVDVRAEDVGSCSTLFAVLADGTEIEVRA